MKRHWKYLANIDAGAWVKAYYSHGPKCDNITNNVSEVWNSKIRNYRAKPILSMCEELRCYIMRRMAAHKRVLGTVTGKIAPAQQKRLEKLKIANNVWTPTWTRNLVQDMYEVSGRGEKNEAAENYVHQWLTMDALHATYEHTLNPVNSDEYWPSSDEPKPVPPPLKRPAGRPKKHRRKDPTEDQEKSTTKLKRTRLVKCSKCGQLGHYAKTCKGPATPRNKQKSAPMSISIETNMHGEIPLSQGGPAPEIDSQPARGSSPQPSIPTESSHLPSEETMRAASSGTRTRFMSTPGFRAPRRAPSK
ncbi:hypothetical protein K1719_037620 [Acacia pycnantha]|nr:hypothetical protein K1719_037620 [Acacia pycnantha]